MAGKGKRSLNAADLRAITVIPPGGGPSQIRTGKSDPSRATRARGKKGR